MQADLGVLPLVAILRGLGAHEAPQVGRALFDAGFRLLEVPLNRPGALAAIQALLQIAPPDAIIGGGTMLSVEHVEQVHAAGGRMMVSPNFDAAVVRRAVALDMLAFPGVVTPSEAWQALAAGAHGLKLFPAEMIPPAAVKALRSVLPPEVLLMPVGGIDVDNMAAYARAGANGFGIGGALYQSGVAPAALAQAAAAFISARQRLIAAD
ncbi:2-dehydro-3-deoxy-6-phosphogalactonate aldolase [Lacisediminimonas sp.]|uniref:2-dehydro-3-deoxy-6-phosphogalactonate aldolase n=1 Tax=Lacisediminimonas sp. TaxID=3060582 RepID=UPI002726ECB0|nr:2-dehydro-3-deoxy-6-phosphogalactonate aldolase [Lacisediminimonas sp.]MDO8298835.1 2-dehydro-3-deoxy-6-phosphogalactonate aldolase [Lacisediminimonas sp.]